MIAISKCITDRFGHRNLFVAMFVVFDATRNAALWAQDRIYVQLAHQTTFPKKAWNWANRFPNTPAGYCKA
jgi:hypothetical protein